MGYTHYWYRVPELDEATFAKAVADCKVVCKESGVKLKYEYDSSVAPAFCKTQIRFNGVQDDGCETFYVPQKFVDSGRPRHGGKCFDFCKTRGRPYDLAVTACLVVLKQHFGDQVVVCSDGESKDWDDARKLCQKHLGFGLEFKLHKGE